MGSRLVRLVMALALAGSAASSLATDYCIDGATGNDANTGLCTGQAWRTLAPSQSTSFSSGDRILIAAGRYVHPLTGWYMTPGVSWIGAGADFTTVVFNKPTPSPFVRFRTGTNGSGAPSDLRPAPFTNTTVLSDLTLRNEGQAVTGIDIAVTSGDSAPTITRVVVENFPTGILLHPSSDERQSASTHAVLTQSVIRGAGVAGLDFFADVFYARAVTEASTATNVMVQAAQAGALVRTLVNDLGDAGMPSSQPTLTNCTMRGGTESTLLLVSYYNDGTIESRVSSNAGATAATIRNGIFSGSSRYGIEEWSAFNEPAALTSNALGGNALGDYRDEGTTTRAATAVGTGNIGDVPQFVDASTGDLHVLATSTTLDRIAAAQAPAIDVDGQARPQGAMADMGADEWFPCTAFADASASLLAPPCSGGATTLDASRSTVVAACSRGLLYEWWSGTTLVGSGVTLAVTPSVTTTYTLRVRCADPALSACFDEDSIEITPSPAPPFADAGTNQGGCAEPGSSVDFDLAGAASAVPPATVTAVQWSAPEGTFTDSSSTTTRFTVLAGATSKLVTATLLVTDSAGCTASDTVSVAVDPVPGVSLAPVPAQCVGAAAVSIPLSAIANGGTPPHGFGWTASRGSVTGTDTATLTLTPAATSETIDVTVTVTDSRGCSVSAMQSLRLVPQPTAQAGADSALCLAAGSTVIPLAGTATTGEPPLTFHWTASQGNIANADAAVTELNVLLGSVTTTITATLEVTSALGDCMSTDERVISLSPTPVANAGGPYSGLQGGGTTSLALDGGASTGEPTLSFAWTTDLGTFLDSGTASSSLPNPVLSIPDAPTIQRANACLTVTSVNSCVSDVACTTAVALLTPVLPPDEVSPTLRVTKAPPLDLRLSWNDAPVDGSHDAASAYELWTATRACGPFAMIDVISRVAGPNEAFDPVLASPPRLRYLFIRSVNDGGASIPSPPNGALCR